MTTETVAFRMTLHPHQAAEYRRRHTPIWPELEKELRERGVLDYRIFLDAETNALFAVMTRRTDHRLDTLPDTEIMQLWWRMMSDIMRVNPDHSPVQVPLAEMFVMDGGRS